jgi:DNA-binding XRE family transcriptional regulator
VGRVPGCCSTRGAISLSDIYTLRILVSTTSYLSRFFVSFRLSWVQANERNERGEVPTIEIVKIGRNLRRLREDRLLTQAELAERAGIALSSLVRIENDQVDPRFSSIRKLARALEVHPRELTGRPDDA